MVGVVFELEDWGDGIVVVIFEDGAGAEVTAASSSGRWQ